MNSLVRDVLSVMSSKVVVVKISIQRLGEGIAIVASIEGEGKLPQSVKTGTETFLKNQINDYKILSSCWSELLISAVISMVALGGVSSTLTTTNNAL